MAKNELRGASRRQFIQSATALGAVLGWGPARIKDFIARGAGDAVAANSASQNLVVLHGKQGAHGYPHLLFPHPDSYPNRTSDQLCQAFMQRTTATGAVGNSLNGALAGLGAAVYPDDGNAGVQATLAARPYGLRFRYMNQTGFEFLGAIQLELPRAFAWSR